MNVMTALLQAQTIDPNTLVTTAVAWILGILGTVFGLFVGWHALRELAKKDRELMALAELAGTAIVAGALIFDPGLLPALARGVVHILGLQG